MTGKILQEWEGFVTEVRPDAFSARLTDLTAGDTYDEWEGEIAVKNVRGEDRGLVAEGAFFNLAVRECEGPDGTRESKTEVVFRRDLVTTGADLEAARAWAEETAEAFAEGNAADLPGSGHAG